MNDENELKNNNSKSIEDDMDDTFVELKEKPITAIVIIVLLLLITGAGLAYYFIIDSPKTIFTTATNNILSKINIEETNNENIKYSLNINITSNDKEYTNIFDVINQIELEGTMGIKDDITQANGLINYKNKKLLDYNFLIDKKDDSTIYAKFVDLYDKVIKIKPTEEETDKSVADIDINDYNQVILSVKESLTSSLETANFHKEIIKLNNDFVKKITLIIDEDFLVNFYNKLLQDNAFMESYAKINNITIDKLSDSLNNAIRDAKGNDESISIYLTALKNEFLKFEYVNSEDNFILEKKENKYNFEISESYTTKYKGYIKLKEVNEENLITVNISSIEDEMTVELNLKYTTLSTIELLDTKNAINYEEITEEEYANIINKLLENDTFITLLKDLKLENLDQSTLPIGM